jgi:hypothetical protein
MRFRLALLFALAVLASPPVFAQAALDITLKHGSPGEARTRDQLQRVIGAYDLAPWIYTKSFVIDEQAIPFSHPVLTLHTRHLKDDELFVSTFAHEEFHWFLADKGDATNLAIADLRKMFPSVPAGGTAGARDEYSSYLHLLVCYLEQQADLKIFGELKTKQIMEFWAGDHYTWIYKTVIDRSPEIGRIMRDRKLMPAL